MSDHDDLKRAVREFLAAYDRTIFYECDERDPIPDDPAEPDDLPLDGANCPITVGMIRKLRKLVNA